MSLRPISLAVKRDGIVYGQVVRPRKRIGVWALHRVIGSDGTVGRSSLWTITHVPSGRALPLVWPPAQTQRAESALRAIARVDAKWFDDAWLGADLNVTGKLADVASRFPSAAALARGSFA